MLLKRESTRSIFVFTMILFLGLSFSARSQCDVTITPQSTTTFCEGGSVTLVASANGDSLQLDQSQTFYNGGTSARNLPGYSYWQSFEAGITGTLVQIDAGFFTTIDGTGYWTVWEGSGTGGIMLDSQAVNIYCDGGNCLISFEENIPVSAGEIYTFQIRGGPGMPDPYGLQIGTDNPYASGEMGFVDPSGTYLTDFDWVFKTWVQSGSVTYAWSNGETDSAITVNEDGEYIVTVTSASGCTSSASAEVTVNPLPDVMLQVADDSVCVSDATVMLTGTPAGGIYSGSNVSGNVFAPSTPGDYIVFYTYTDVNGCTNSASADIVVTTCTAVDLVNSPNNISVVYNAADEKIMIHAGDQSIGADVSLYNIYGEKILNRKLLQQTTSLDTDFASGIWFYEVRKNDKVISSGKIWVQK